MHARNGAEGSLRMKIDLAMVEITEQCSIKRDTTMHLLNCSLNISHKYDTDVCGRQTVVLNINKVGVII
jgi:hypothetical protein